jgi:iron(III) transport system permease protein
VTRRGSRRPPLLLATAGIAVATLLLLPLVYLVVRAGGGDAWEVVWQARTLELIWRTGVLVAGVVAATLLVAVPFAWLVVRTDLPWRRFWAVAGALPLVIPSYVAALCLLGALGPRGLLADALGRELPELRGYWGALLALTLATYPYVFLLASAALRDLDPALEEASRSLGRSRATTFRRVTLPALRPSLGAGTLLVGLYVLSDFGVVSLMNYDALTRAIFLQYRSLFDRTPAAALSLVLVAFTMLLLLAETRARRKGRLHRTSPGVSRAPRPQPLGRWKAPALAFCALTVGGFLLLPASVLLYWLARGLGNERGVELRLQDAVNSVVASGLAATLAVAAAVPVALLAVRYRSRWALLERSVFAANALPGIVIALSLVFFAARYAPFVYQTLALLVLAYVIRFLPQALAALETALGRISPSVEEAARSLGRREGTVLVRVTLPLAKSGIGAGAALVFLSAMKELPATLLLRPIGFETLATAIWRETSVAAYSQAAPAALLLIVLSAPFLLLLWRRDRSPSATPD